MTTVLESINQSLNKALRDDHRVILMGEDILDPYGGAFKVTRGLSTLYPEQVITTPISEAGIVGIATGMALRGYKPVVEIMFGDFSTLIVDQVINHLAKFKRMFLTNQPLPVVIRTPMGGRRGYGPTHSQSLERLFFGVDGLRVIAPNHLVGLSGDLLYDSLLRQDEPTIFIEHKLQYLLDEINPSANPDILSVDEDDQPYSPRRLSVRGAPRVDLVLVTYGYMLELAIQAMLDLAYEEELFINIIAFTQLSPLIISEKVLEVLKTYPVLIVEEGPLGWGWGAELAAQLGVSPRQKPIQRLASRSALIPAAPALENRVLPQKGDIIHAIKSMRGAL